MADNDAPDLQDIVDFGAWGPDPGQDYRDGLDLLDNVVRECIWVSKRYEGIASPEGRHFYASVLFVALITRGVSLLNLAPYSSWAEKKIEHWDYASMTGIVRTMIELRSAFYYLCSDPCSKDEWYCRWNLFNLHDCVSRIRLFSAQGNAEQVAGFEVQADELRERLRSNPFFTALDPKHHKALLHGQTAYIFPLETLAERAGMPVDTFRWLYILFSTHVHALPMSFYRLGGVNEERGRGLPSSAEESYSTLCLTLAANLIVRSRDELHALFEGLERDPAYPDDRNVDGDKVQGLIDEETLLIGETSSLDLDDELRIELRRESQTLISVSYVLRRSGHVVFNGIASEKSGLEFEYIDPYYWEILLDGAKASREEIEQMMDNEFLMRIDLVGRRILFRTRPVDL